MPSQDSNFEMPSKPAVGGNHRPWYRRWWGQLLVLFAALVLAVAFAFGLYVARLAVMVKNGQLTPNSFFSAGESASRMTLSQALATADDPSYGPRDAKVVVIEFSDFQCPFCAELYPVLKQAMKNYGDRVLFIYRDFPLVSDHPQALLGAMGGECAHEQGKFWEMHNKIFENQGEITESSLKSYAVQLGLNSVKFGECLTSSKFLDEIERDLQDGYAAGVRATPTLFINGGKVSGAINYETLEKIISNELLQ